MLGNRHQADIKIGVFSQEANDSLKFKRGTVDSQNDPGQAGPQVCTDGFPSSLEPANLSVRCVE